MREKEARDPLTRTNESVAKPREKNNRWKTNRLPARLHRFCRRKEKEKSLAFPLAPSRSVEIRNSSRFDSKRVLITIIVTILVEKMSSVDCGEARASKCFRLRSGIKFGLFQSSSTFSFLLVDRQKKKKCVEFDLPRKFPETNEGSGDKSIRIDGYLARSVMSIRIDCLFDLNFDLEQKRNEIRPLWNSKSDGNRRDRESILANSILSLFSSFSLSFSLSLDGFRLRSTRSLAMSSLLRLSSDWGRYGSLSRDGRAFILNEIIVCLFFLEYAGVERHCFCFFSVSFSPILRAINLMSRKF